MSASSLLILPAMNRKFIMNSDLKSNLLETCQSLLVWLFYLLCVGREERGREEGGREEGGRWRYCPTLKEIHVVWVNPVVLSPVIRYYHTSFHFTFPFPCPFPFPAFPHAIGTKLTMYTDLFRCNRSPTRLQNKQFLSTRPPSLVPRPGNEAIDLPALVPRGQTLFRTEGSE